MQTAGYSADQATTYHSHHRTFLIRQRVDLVWETYKTIHPREAWHGEMVSFGLQYSTIQNKLSYLEDEYSGMEEGQVIILNLKLLLGALNIAVAHQVVELSEGEMLIKLSYMMGGASEGSQWIRMKATPDGLTEVSHQTLYKSQSSFRDKSLYPILHSKAITEFHESVRKKAEGLKSPIVA